MKEITLKEFLDTWEAGLIIDESVHSFGEVIYGKSVKGQADNPQGSILVFAVKPETKEELIETVASIEEAEKKWYQIWKR